MKTKGNIANIIIVIVMFSAYTISALFLSIIGAEVYENNAADSESSYNTRTSVLYLTEKIRQNDLEGGISLSSWQGGDMLVLHRDYDGRLINTLIYVEDGELCEISVPEDFELSPGVGQKIMPITSIDFEMNIPGLLELSVVDDAGVTHSSSVYVRCETDIQGVSS